MSLSDDLDLIDAASARIRATIPPVVPSVVTVKAGDNLQAALDAGGQIQIEAGAQFAGTFLLKSNTTLAGISGAAVRGATAPTLMVPPGTKNVMVSGLTCSSGHSEVIRVGENDATQTKLEDAPEGVTFSAVKVPIHRGKRAFCINGKNVSLLDCEATDIYDPNGSDSQAVYIGNAPGAMLIKGGRYSAGSEIILSGGDTMRIPGLTPDGIVIDGAELFRPLSWQTDGIARKVKNLVEIKNGRNVVIRKSTLSGCWAQGQAGEAIMLTPALDGAKLIPPARSGEVVNVLVEDCTISNVGSVANLLGRGYTCYTPNALAGVVFRRVKATVDHLKFGGRGQLAILQGEPVDVLFDDCDITASGSSTLYFAFGTVLDPVTLLSRPGGKLGSLAVKNSRITLGSYGFNLGGYANATNWQASVGVLDVSGNTFAWPASGPTSMKINCPANTYLP